MFSFSLVLLALALPAPAQSQSRSGSESAASAPSAQQSQSKPRSKIAVRSSRFGKVLFDGRGYVLYLFDRERTSKPQCYGACATAWPPYIVKSKPKASNGARSSLIGTTRRRDGRLQATYAGKPLYYYEHDGRGQILCHDVQEFGGGWFVVKPDGKRA